MTEEQGESGVSTVSRDKIQVEKPKQFKVILINDDYTTTDFVVSVLETVFKKTPAEAVQIMLQVHRGGRGVCGIYTRQIAEAKVTMVRKRARSEGYPLQCVMEEV